jgi:drug/metabolite transporter (DMT)-like permease
VVQPSFAAVGWPALLPLGVAVNFALFMLSTRQLAKDTDPISLQVASGLIACVILVPALVIGTWAGITPLQIIWPQGTAALLVLASGAVGTAAHLMMTWSLRYAPSATLAPMQYLEIPFATLMGWLIFGDLPGPLASLGIFTTLGAGLYIIWREQITQRQIMQSQATAQAEQPARQ